MAPATFSLENEVLSKFMFYATVVLLKTVLMSLWTARYRIPRKVFISSEDYGGEKVAITRDEDVERVRRAHQNDLENILPFVLLGILYVMTGPDLADAVLRFRLFAGARLIHTFVYLLVIPQPARALSWFVGIGVNISLAISILRVVSF